MEKSTPLCNGKGSNANKVQDSETSLLVKADKNYVDDSERTQKSCLDVVFELLATTAAQALRTRCLNQFIFLSLNFKLKDIDQMCYDRKLKDRGSPRRIQMHIFWCNIKRWRI